MAGFGDEMPALDGLRRGHGIIGTIAATGIGEIVNDVDADRAARSREHELVKALIARAAEGGRAHRSA